MVWLKFIVCVIIIFLAGSRIARYGDIIAEKSGMGRVWVGMLVLAAITSMPELVTSVSAVTIIHEANLGMGTLVGTCLFNICILAVMDILRRGSPLLSQVSTRHIRAAAVSMVLAGIVAAGILLGDRFSFLDLKMVGLPTLLVFVLYVAAVWRLSQDEKKFKAQTSQELPVMQYGSVTEKGLWAKFSLAALVIVGAGIWLSFIGDEIATVTGWDTSFVGSLLLAVTTSLPEITVVFAALRLGATDLAVADVLGANMLDLSYLFVVDLLYAEEALLASASSSNLVTLGLLMTMNLVLILGMRFQTPRKTFRVVSWYAPLLLALYMAGAYALFAASSG